MPRSLAFLRPLLLFAFAIISSAQPFPAKDWPKAGKPESAGFSQHRLAALTPLLETLDTSAMIVVAKGQVVFEYGDLSKLSYLASCRKSVLAMLCGNYVASGKIQLDKTLRDSCLARTRAKMADSYRTKV